jgi:hypothetical protein
MKLWSPSAACHPSRLDGRTLLVPTICGNPKTKEEIDMKTNSGTTGNELSVEQWLAIRKEAGLRIDPATADVMWCHALTLDPYGVKPDLPEEYHQVGREYFARAPGSDIWVLFGDLPEETARRLWEKHGSRLSFPAGILAVNTLFHADGSQDDELPF